MLKQKYDDLIIQTGCCRRLQTCCELADMNALQTLVAEKFSQAALAVVWQPHRVLWGGWRGGEFCFSDGSEIEPAQIEELRVFNETGELYLQRKDQSFIVRWLEDGRGETKEFVDSCSRLWGKRQSGAAEGFVRLLDCERKICMDVPAGEDSRYYGLVTRNYIEYDEETGQAGYGAYRFLNIVAMGGTEE